MLHGGGWPGEERGGRHTAAPRAAPPRARRFRPPRQLCHAAMAASATLDATAWPPCAGSMFFSGWQHRRANGYSLATLQLQGAALRSIAGPGTSAFSINVFGHAPAAPLPAGSASPTWKGSSLAPTHLLHLQPFCALINCTSFVFNYAQTNINSEGFRSLREGGVVEFEVEAGPDGRSKAVNVSGPEGIAPEVSRTATRLDYDVDFSPDQGFCAPAPLPAAAPEIALACLSPPHKVHRSDLRACGVVSAGAGGDRLIAPLVD